MFVFFSDVAKVGIKPIKSYIQRMEADGVSHAVIVVQEGMTPAAKQVCRTHKCLSCAIVNITYCYSCVTVSSVSEFAFTNLSMNFGICSKHREMSCELGWPW